MGRIDKVIWDFNGTLYDDIDIGVKAVNLMLSRRGLPIIPDAEAYRAIFGFPIKDYYRRAGFDFERFPYETELAPEWVAEYRRLEDEATLRSDAKASLLRLREAGIGQILVSATEEGMLRRQLKKLGIIDAFDGIFGSNTIEAAGKEALVLRACNTYPGERTVMIGDTTHDIDCARSVGLECLSVADGHQSASTLKEAGGRVLPTPGDCVDYIMNENEKYRKET